MKHVKLGCGILAVILALGLALTACLSSLKSELCNAMDAAAEAALTGNWAEADTAAGEGRQTWLRHRNFVAAVVDHELLEEADTLFAQLEVYRRCRLSPEYAVVCRCLVRQMEAIGESQSLKWWHLL
jgi:outer membrane PBP1 activator LpoA protein